MVPSVFACQKLDQLWMYSRCSCYQFTLSTYYTSHKTQLNKVCVCVCVFKNSPFPSTAQSLPVIGVDQLLSSCCLSLWVSLVETKFWTLLTVHVIKKLLPVTQHILTLCQHNGHDNRLSSTGQTTQDFISLILSLKVIMTDVCWCCWC